jgi:hypothetical protein
MAEERLEEGDVASDPALDRRIRSAFSKPLSLIHDESLTLGRRLRGSPELAAIAKEVSESSSRVFVFLLLV